MYSLYLTPLGAGNYQYVYRITNLSNKYNNFNSIDTYDKNNGFSDYVCHENFQNHSNYGILGKIPRNSILKLPKGLNVNNYASRIGFHHQFNGFLNHFNTNVSQMMCSHDRNVGISTDLRNVETDGGENEMSNIANNVPSKILCIIERSVSQKLRTMFNVLLNPSGKYADNTAMASDSNTTVTINGCEKSGMNNDIKKINKNKISIFYDDILEKNYSMEIDADSIKILDVNGMMEYVSQSKVKETLRSKRLFDYDKYELCSIEEDLFNIDSVIDIGNINENVELNGVSVTSRFNDVTKSKEYFKNISLEIKIKCGLKNFKNYPSMFEMKQINKRNVNYIISNGTEMVRGKHESHYDPCNFFELNHESIRDELIKLMQTPQNNLRIFANNYQMLPEELFGSKMENRVTNGVKVNQGYVIKRTEEESIGKVNMEEDGDDLVEFVVRSIMENRKKLIMLLKLQALAAGQQFLASAMYTIYSLLLRMDVITSSNKERNSEYIIDMILEGDDIIGNVIKRNDKIGNVSGSEDDSDKGDHIVMMIRKMGLYNQFKSNKRNEYEIQRAFYQKGMELIHLMYIKLISVLNSTKCCSFYTNSGNLTVHRVSNKFNLSNYRIFKLMNEVIGCILRLLQSDSDRTNDSGYVVNMPLKRSKISSDIRNGGIDLLILDDSVIKTVMKTIYYRNKKGIFKGRCNISNCNSSMASRSELERIREWINMYLYGRVAMDLSIIVNVLYSEPKNEAKGSRMLYNNISFVDLDLKSIDKIYKYENN
ncbi:hypothetical protein MACK_001871 [Theileria orientalis]|uniref:inositol-pentakisphosphate 2-kinase n=1 Tax=Theileria orientalis TaxID=68886 RepID=A0A976MB73_THEOR|nr:hypothetical protein MACK_001871 [Theileria orientalis]